MDLIEAGIIGVPDYEAAHDGFPGKAGVLQVSKFQKVILILLDNRLVYNTG
jgi:hypothetical protein